jgi:hypothetical protein
VIAVLAIAAVAFLVLRGGDDEEASDDVTLESISDVGANPWTDNLDVGNPDLDRVEIALDDVPSVDADDRGELGVPIDGDEGGLFGGRRNEVACDKDEIAGQLSDDDDKASAFAGVQDIDADDIGDFVDDLTAVQLRTDVRVADHGFVESKAERFEAVLERGTAVLVDDEGIPRVRCASGSPLATASSTGTDEKFRGVEWPGFDKDRVVVIDGSDVGDAFVLVDNDDADIFLRPRGSAGDDDTDADADIACDLNPDSLTCVGVDDTTTTEGGSSTTEPTLGTGDVQFTLRWNSSADMDLAVTDPTGARVSFASTSVPSGGQLDVDANANCGSVDPSVENVFWPPGTAPAGTYTVEVSLFSDCDNGAQDFQLTAVVAGQTQTQAGTLVNDSDVQTFTFSL